MCILSFRHAGSAGTAEQSELQSAENLLAMEQARCELEEEAGNPCLGLLEMWAMGRGCV